MATNCTVTVRDFLTDRHGFTLPASRLSSYSATLKHSSSSLFRHPKAFAVHFHRSVNENDCMALLDKDKWEHGKYFTGEKVTFWAHFVRIPDVDLFGEPLGNEGGIDKVKQHGKALQDLPVERMRKINGKREVEFRDRPAKKRRSQPKVRGGYSLPPPNANMREYYSRYTEIVPLPKSNGYEATRPAKTASLFPGFQPSVAVSTTAQAAQGNTLFCAPQQAIRESPLFEPEVEIKQELSPDIFQDDGGFEWNDSGCC